MAVKHFKTKEEALSYAAENLGKHDVLMCVVAGQTTFLTATSLPLEEELRTNLEAVMTKFMVKQLNVNKEDAEQLAIELGAEHTGPILDNIAQLTGKQILSADLCY